MTKIWVVLFGAVNHMLVWLVLIPIYVYRYTLSPLIGRDCRFLPTCSQYTIEALRTHGVWSGSILGIRRIGRCHPWGGDGHDPVPPRNTSSEPSE
jgi:putative membrane protein insertion efficiency factor